MAFCDCMTSPSPRTVRELRQTMGSDSLARRSRMPRVAGRPPRRRDFLRVPPANARTLQTVCHIRRAGANRSCGARARLRLLLADGLQHAKASSSSEDSRIRP